MQIGVFAKTFPGTHPDNVLAACKSAGFDTVQYNMSCSGLGPLPASISLKKAQQVARASEITGVQIAAVSATYNMMDPDKERRKDGRLAFEAIASSATGLGTNLLTVCSGSMDPHDKWRHHPANNDTRSWMEMCREFEIILDQAQRHNLFIGVEPEQANIVSSAHKALQLLNEFPESNIRIIFDPANLVEGTSPDRQNETIEEALDLLGPTIVLAHAKDRSVDGQIAPAGAGSIDWSLVLRGLSNIGFDGPVIAHGMLASEAPVVAQHLRCQVDQL